MSPREILDFWFHEIEPRDWWVKDPDFDSMMQARFGVTLNAASQGELWTWRKTPIGCLAEVIVLDQFSRNIHRDTPHAFGNDGMALALAQTAVEAGVDDALSTEQRLFLYMPYMHSESSAIHEQAVLLFSQPGLEENLGYEHKHKVIIDRFGRYPHRNHILGRESTPAELSFLEEPGSSF